MPHLRFRGMKKEELKLINKELILKLEKIVNVPKDHFTVEFIPSVYFFDGEEGKNSYPFVEIKWFSRDENIKKETVKVIDELLRQFGYEDIAVYFEELNPKNYYENLEHF